MNISIERKRVDSSVLPTKSWTPRDDALKRNNNMPSGKVDVFYYGSSGGIKKPPTVVDNKSQLVRHLNDSLDVTPPAAIPMPIVEFQSSKIMSSTHPITVPRNASSLLKRKLTTSSSAIGVVGATGSLCSSGGGPPSALRHHLEFSRGLRTDISLVPPIRQTASIFKQPVTVYRTQDSKVKNDLKRNSDYNAQDKPRQLFWEKRLEGLRSCDVTGSEFAPIDLPKGIMPVGPNVSDQTLLQSVATALHVSNQPVTGQTTAKQVLNANTGVFLNPEQPLMYSISVTEDDIRRQEDRVTLARRRLQEALKA